MEGEDEDEDDALGDLASRILEIEAAKGQRLRAPMLAEERDNEEDARRGMGEMMMDGAYTINWDGHDATVVQNFRCTTREVRSESSRAGRWLRLNNTGRDAAEYRLSAAASLSGIEQRKMRPYLPEQGYTSDPNSRSAAALPDADTRSSTPGIHHENN